MREIGRERESESELLREIGREGERKREKDKENKRKRNKKEDINRQRKGESIKKIKEYMYSKKYRKKDKRKNIEIEKN